MLLLMDFGVDPFLFLDYLSVISQNFLLKSVSLEI